MQKIVHLFSIKVPILPTDSTVCMGRTQNWRSQNTDSFHKPMKIKVICSYVMHADLE